MSVMPNYISIPNISKYVILTIRYSLSCIWCVIGVQCCTIRDVRFTTMQNQNLDKKLKNMTKINENAVFVVSNF